MTRTNGTIVANENALGALVNELDESVEAYNFFAVSQDASIHKAITEAFVLALDANATRSKIDDLTARVFTSVVQIDQEIQRLRLVAIADANRVAASIEISDEDPVHNLDRDRAIERARNQYDSEIERLQRKRESFVNFINSQLNVYKEKDLTNVTSASKEIVSRLQSVQELNMGHAYIVLRLAGARQAISNYIGNMANGEKNAMANFLRALPTVLPAGQVGNPADPRGGSWYETERQLKEIARENAKNPPVHDIAPPMTAHEIGLAAQRKQLESLKEQLGEKKKQLAALPQQDAADRYINVGKPNANEREIYTDAISDARRAKLEDEIYKLEERIHVLEDDIANASNGNNTDANQTHPNQTEPKPAEAPITFTG